MSEHLSEIARLKHQIELEYIAATQGLQGYAQISRHDFIETRMNNMRACHQQLASLVGADEAIKMIVEVIEHESTAG